MAKLNLSFYSFLRVLLGIGLFIAFIFISAKPSLENYNNKKVMTDVSKIKQETLMTPAVTICGADMVT